MTRDRARDAQGRGSTHAARSGGGRRPGCSARGPFPRSRGRGSREPVPARTWTTSASSFPAGPSVSGRDENQVFPSPPPCGPLRPPKRVCTGETQRRPGAAPAREWSRAPFPSPVARHRRPRPRPPPARRPLRVLGRARRSLRAPAARSRPRGRAGRAAGPLVGVGLGAPAGESTWIQRLRAGPVGKERCQVTALAFPASSRPCSARPGGDSRRGSGNVLCATVRD